MKFQSQIKFLLQEMSRPELNVIIFNISMLLTADRIMVLCCRYRQQGYC